MTALSELLNLHLPDGWNGKRLAEEAQRKGHLLNRATAADYLRGKHARVPGEGTLEAFADTLSIPIGMLRDAAQVPRGEDERWTPPTEASRLSQRQRDALDELIRSMAVERGTGQVLHLKSPVKSPKRSDTTLRSAAHPRSGDDD